MLDFRGFSESGGLFFSLAMGLDLTLPNSVKNKSLHFVARTSKYLLIYPLQLLPSITFLSLTNTHTCTSTYVRSFIVIMNYLFP